MNIIHLKHLTVVLTVLRQQIFAKPKKKFNQTFKYLLKEHLLILLRLQVFWVKVHQELESQDCCNAA